MSIHPSLYSTSQDLTNPKNFLSLQCLAPGAVMQLAVYIIHDATSWPASTSLSTTSSVALGVPLLVHDLRPSSPCGKPAHRIPFFSIIYLIFGLSFSFSIDCLYIFAYTYL
ncbi:hypothetical protein BDV26DRAFT_82230 [Aspergillus bertholletiae]|uniref:Uncharacterized protein n=1 Tax=Aspergillus bertholletiae TaxID=1226010 RepID=A0A5N7ASN3_9EURO|nr:hypothetical protein BDV26DRAFT_82230 [Aspergillus bertholletiae]